MNALASRREFIRSGTLASAAVLSRRPISASEERRGEVQDAIERALQAPVLRKALWRDPVIITAVDVLKAGEQFLIRVRSKDGAVGLSVGHPDVLDTPHMSDGGLGYLYVAHFASCVPNARQFQEYKGRDDSLPVSSDSAPLNSEMGMLKVPTGHGLGVTIDPAFVDRAVPVF